MLEAVFLIRRIPAWSTNLGKRETRAPKVFITDPGLAGQVKAAVDITTRDVRHLAQLRDRITDQFTIGVLVYCGDQVLPLGDRLWAVPLSALWETW